MKNYKLVDFSFGFHLHSSGLRFFHLILEKFISQIVISPRRKYIKSWTLLNLQIASPLRYINKPRRGRCDKYPRYFSRIPQTPREIPANETRMMYEENSATRVTNLQRRGFRRKFFKRGLQMNRPISIEDIFITVQYRAMTFLKSLSVFIGNAKRQMVNVV